MKSPSNQFIGLCCILAGVGLAVYIFAASRNDPGLRMAALVCATGAVTTVLAIGSITFTGKDLAHPIPPDVPPGSAATTSTTTTTAQTIQTPAKSLPVTDPTKEQPK